MNRAEFFARLERGLRRLPDARRAEILADYQSYFAEGAAAGRAETELAASLGDPARLAAELALGHAVESSATGSAARAALRTLRALVTLVLLHGVAWLPLLAGFLLVVLLLAGSGVALAYGCFKLAVEAFDAPLGGFIAVLLSAVGYFSAALGLFALSQAGLFALAKGFIQLQVLNRRVLRHSSEVST